MHARWAAGRASAAMAVVAAAGLGGCGGSGEGLDANGRPNGVMGVPADYRPASRPVSPAPVSSCPSGDPNCETNNVFVPLNNGTLQRVCAQCSN